jgi:hypothetical protein
MMRTKLLALGAVLLGSACFGMLAGCGGTTKHLSAEQVKLTQEVHNLEEEKKLFKKERGDTVAIIDTELSEKRKALQESREQEKIPVKRVSAEEANLAYARSTIAVGVLRCIHTEQQSDDTKIIVGGRSEKEDSEVSHAVRELIAAYRKSGNSKQIRTELAEEAESLQKYCWPWLAREIRTVLTYG